MDPPNIESTYGALLIGVFISIFFQGVLSVQAYIYYENFREDSLKMKALVAIVWTLDFVQLVLICQTMYYYLVRNWGNQAVLLETTTELDLHLVFLTGASIICQGFFLRRVWKFSKNKILTGILAAACLATGIIDVVMAVQTIHNKSIATILSHTFSGEVIGVFAVGAAVDLLIAVILVWYLQRELTMFDRINSLVARLIQYTIATGLITSLLALGCLIAYVASPNSLIFLGMHFSLGRMYTNALLATLNSRKVLRAHLSPSNIEWSGVSAATRSAPEFAPQSEIATQDFAMKAIGEVSRSSNEGEAFDSAV
ncbi:hypothetical protein B0H13DRAFT_2270386 [Mycena leptocephala]|nr:hypothetical protein B0H13DRAFT_2270386 [Mycena leptocephala]